jgi:hypothetical protein
MHVVLVPTRPGRRPHLIDEKARIATIHKRSLLVCLLTLIAAISLAWLPGCTTVPDPADQTNWIEIGKTTKADVVARYGEPDLTQRIAIGTVVIYLPVLKYPPPPPAVPTIQTMQPTPAGFGVAMTNPIEPRLAVADVGGGAHGRPWQGLSIRYDAQDVVRETFE